MQKLACKPFSFSRVPGSEQVLKIILATIREGNKDNEGKKRKSEDSVVYLGGKKW